MKKFLIGFFVGIFAFAMGAGATYYFLIYEDSDIKIPVVDNEIQKGINNIYDAVVVVQNIKNDKVASIGSGFIYDNNGHVMTNHHVIEKASEVKDVLMSGETLTATVISICQSSSNTGDLVLVFLFSPLLLNSCFV